MARAQAVIYTRVSTDEQAETGTSLRDQLATCRAKAAALDAEIVAEFEDAGVSGAYYTARPGMQAALALIDEGKANTLIVANLSRFSRDREHQSAIKKRIELVGARLVFCDQTFEATPQGDLVFGMMGNIAHYERQVITAQMTRGKRTLATEGLQPSRGAHPYGYHVVTRNDVLSARYTLEQLGKYQIVPEQAEWLAQIFEWFAAGASLREIGRRLTAAGVLSPSGATVWYPSTLRDILSNPVVIGRPQYGKTVTLTDERRMQRGLGTVYSRPAPPESIIELTAPPVIDDALFCRCAETLANARQLRSGNPNRRYLLSGLLRCPTCKGSLNGAAQGKRDRPVYTCDHCRRSEAGSSRYYCHKLEPCVINAISTLVDRPELTQAAVTAYTSSLSQDDSAALLEKLRRDEDKLLRRERSTIEAQIAAIDAGRDRSVYDSILDEISSQRRELAKQIADARARSQSRGTVAKSDVAAILALCAETVREVLTDESGNTCDKRSLLQMVIREIYPEGLTGVVIALREPIGTGETVVRVSIRATVSRFDVYCSSDRAA